MPFSIIQQVILFKYRPAYFERAAVCYVAMIRCRVRFIVKVLSPRDGGWIRMFGYFKTYADALQCVNLFMPMMNLAGDYDNFQIKKTVCFFPIATTSP